MSRRLSSIDRLPSTVRKSIEKMVRARRHTLDEIIAQIRNEFGDEQAPSRSSLHRYAGRFDEMTKRMREIQAASEVLVAEFGEDVQDKAGALLAQAVTTLATDAALVAQDKELSVKEVGELARAARAVLETRKMSLAERREIERLVLERQAKQAEGIAREQGLSDDQWSAIRAKFLGIREAT